LNPLRALDWLDWVGLVSWIGCWIGYSLFARSRGATHANIGAAMARYRRAWMREAYRRENRITDVALVGSLAQSATFFSSTTLLILGGLFALLGTIERGAEVLQHLPFAVRASQQLLEIKAVLLMLVFVYAFMRFTWSLRQFNLVNILIGAYPVHRDGDPNLSPDDPAGSRLILQASKLNELAGANFTHGLRAYYYAVPLLLWLINPWILLGGSIAVTGMIWMMEFRSATVTALSVRVDS